MRIRMLTVLIWLLSLMQVGCHDDKNVNPGGGPDGQPDGPVYYSLDQFCMGVDLSYANQIEDHGGVYKDSSQARDVFRIFKEHGANLVRARLWYNPTWTKTVYGGAGDQLYNDLLDVTKTIRRAREQGMGVDLDLHYSDTWADPGHQDPPSAWSSISNIDVLRDSVYNYTYRTLSYLNRLGLMPEMVQIGNEINCGMMVTSAPKDFPVLNVCNGYWAQQGEIINAGIKAVRDVSVNSTVKSLVLLHVADPKNVEWWFDGIINSGHVTDFDVVGFSYYPIWHTTVTVDHLSDYVAKFKQKYDRKVMILEVAYPWTTSGDDNYGNQFGTNSVPVSGYPFTQTGQLTLLKTITQEVMDGGGSGIMYWEPDWITSDMKDLWGTGSSWENCALFDFSGNVIPSMDFMRDPYSQ